MEEFITLKQLQAYDKLKVPGVIYVEELPENPENAVYGIKHEDKETVEYTTKFIDILATYFTEYSSGKFTIREDYEAEVEGTAFKSAALVSGKYFIYSEENCQGLLPGDYSPYSNYTFSISEDIIHTDFYTGKKEDKSYVKLANVDEVERYFIRKEQKGKANGVASLDANGRVPVEQMPVQAFVYLGQWDASTGVFPPDADTPGDFYEVNVAGIIEGIEFVVGDWIVWTSENRWDKSENKNYVTSVNKKRGEVQVYGDNTEIETPSSDTEGRTIKEYIDDITVDGNTWNEDTQDITSKAVLDEEELPETVEDKVYRLNAETYTSVTVRQTMSIQDIVNLGFEIVSDDGRNVSFWWHTTEDKVVITDDDGNKVIRMSLLRDVPQSFSYTTEDGWSHSPMTFVIFKIYESKFSVYAKDTKLVTDNEWQKDRENIAYKNKENVFTETNTFDAVKANSIGKDNTEITFEGDTVDVTGDLQVKCIKEPEAIEIETPALTQNGKYVVTEVDGVDTDVDGKTESIAVVDVTALPAALKDKVYTIKGEEPEPISSTIPLDKERLLALYDSYDKIERPDGLIQCQNFQGDVTLFVDGVKQYNLDLLFYNPQETYWQTMVIQTTGGSGIYYNVPDAPRITYEIKQLPIDKAYAKDVRLATYSELADADKIRTVDNIEPTKDKNVTTKVELSKEAYSQLVAAGIDDPNVTYYVTDEQPSADFINDFIVSAGLTWSSQKIRDAIEAATPVIINDAIKALTTTYSSEKIVQLIAAAVADQLTKTEAAALYQPVGDYATNTAISDMLTKTEAADTYEPKNSDLATKTYVSSNYQPKGNYATTADISDMETKTHAGQTYEPKNSDLATKTWVGQQGFLKSIPEGIVTEDTFRTELQKYVYRSGSDIVFNL
jgi:hypothetical protein